jgi:hypothetical protein
MFPQLSGRLSPERLDRTDTTCGVPDVRLGLLNPLWIGELLRKGELVS